MERILTTGAVRLGFSAQIYRFDKLVPGCKAYADVAPVWIRRKKYVSKA